MKKLFILTLTVIMLLGISCITLGSITWRANMGIDPLNIDELKMRCYIPDTVDNWFTITPEKPYGKLHYINADDLNDINLYYYLNDQTYGRCYNLSGDYTDNTVLSGSYLFDFSLFLGATMIKDGGDSSFYISPGYRYNFGENSYCALRVDYNSEEDYLEYFLTTKYYTDKMFIEGDVLIPDGSSSMISLGLNYLLTDSLVGGVKLLSIEDYFAYELGCTWKVRHDESFIVDTRIGQDDSEDFYSSLSGMYLIMEGLSLGAQCDLKTDDDTAITLKGKYLKENNEFVLAYTLETDTNPAIINFLYQRNF